ncbi:P-loop containing nucleoside triphosphate hydrolase protein [Sordaria brevicollis]|uniref:P-loop containing nucleoside triphosphate hydrolase protein n=1 Tax=Sordaria brevicollis TaxID=83679 RepID=A0AAE0P259_SORBR|nr:P-loop containing nucleoside triphosphate hydrolase protein [Sordaria brevicollis]
MADNAIILSDDDPTLSFDDDVQFDDENDRPRSSASTTTTSLGKRKLSVSFEEKLEWSDDSDDGEKIKARRLAKRRAVLGRGGSRGRGRGGKRGGKKAAAATDKARDDEIIELNPPKIKQEEETDYAEAFIPDYLLDRRKKFNKDRETLREAGLKLPPDYNDIYFSDDEIGASRETKPKFEENSGIKPCRPYKDVELEYSAGVIPACIAQYLRDYQVEGVKFLHQKFVYQKGCILGDDMGLGKTVQVAAFLTAAFGKTGDQRDAKRMRKMRRAGDLWYPRVIIVCPGSLIQNWKNELNRWGWWHVDVYHGSNREDVLQAAKSGRTEIMITTYDTYRNCHEEVNTVDWDCVVADECHIMKNNVSETTRAMDKINAMCRIGLTGTAIQNRYEELWTLLNWTNPGYFGTRAEWNESITKPLTAGQSHDATLKQLSVARTTAKKLVQNLLPEFFLRRMKSLIAHQLPKKTDKVVFCPLTDIQRESYENYLDGEQVTFILNAYHPCGCHSGRAAGFCCYKTLSNGRSWKSYVFPSIITLQKIANHLTLLIPSSSDPRDKQRSELEVLQTCAPDKWKELYNNRESMLSLANPEFCGKWKILRKLLRFWHESGDKVLVFSHSVRLLRILQHLFHNTSYNVSFLDGALSYEERQRVVDEFNTDPRQFVFLISTKAGGVGLNITSANKVVIFDPHWNPSYDLQAQDRAYRIGQIRDVDVFRLVSAGTIEEIVYARQIYKQQQANIGYNASNERRYFKGVQRDKNRKGELFGLENLFTFHADQVVLKDIVNKTNVAEAKAGVNLTDIDLDKAVKDEDEELDFIKKESEENDDETGMSSLAKLITAEDPEKVLEASKSKKPKSDAIAAILASAGVEYTHENSEVIGTSKVEQQLSRRAELAANAADSQLFPGVHKTLFADSQESSDDNDDDEDEDEEDLNGPAAPKKKMLRMHYKFNPPEAVRRRQFCSMAKEFGFQNATDFALVVESWTQEQRRNCLDTFYRRREVKILEQELAKMENSTKKEEDESTMLKPEDGETTVDDLEKAVDATELEILGESKKGSNAGVGVVEAQKAVVMMTKGEIAERRAVSGAAEIRGEGADPLRGTGALGYGVRVGSQTNPTRASEPVPKAEAESTDDDDDETASTVSDSDASVAVKTEEESRATATIGAGTSSFHSTASTASVAAGQKKVTTIFLYDDDEDEDDEL